MAQTNALGADFGELNIGKNGQQSIATKVNGFDAGALVKKLVEAKEHTLKDKSQSFLDTMDKRAEGASKLQDMVKAVAMQAQTLRGCAMGMEASEGVFQSSLLDYNILSTSTTPTPDPLSLFKLTGHVMTGNMTVCVQQLAQYDRLTGTLTNNNFTNAMPLGLSGPYTVGTPITLATNNTLADVVSLTNAAAGNTNCTETTPLGWSGSYTVNTTTITVSPTDTVHSIITALNTASGGTSFTDTTPLGWSGNYTVGTPITLAPSNTLTDVVSLVNTAAGNSDFTVNTPLGWNGTYTINNSSVVIGPTDTLTTIQASINAAFTDQTALGWSGNLTVGNITIPVSPTDSLGSIRETLNASQSSTDTNAFDTLTTRVGPGQYLLSFQARVLATPLMLNTTGLSQNASPYNPQSILPQAPVTTLAARTTALSSLIYLNDPSKTNPIYHTSNIITDLGDILQDGGVLNLLHADPNTTISVGATPNKEAVKSFMQDMIEFHNNLVDFVQDLEEDPNMKDNLALKAVKGIIESITLSPLLFKGTSQLPTLGSAGIILEPMQDATKDSATRHSYKLKMDEKRFQSALDNNFNDLSTLCGFAWSTTDSSFTMLDRPKTWLPSSDPIMDSGAINVSLSKNASNQLAATVTVTRGGQTYTYTPDKINNFDGNTCYLNFTSGELNGLTLSVNNLTTLISGTPRTSTITASQGVFDQYNSALQQLSNKGEIDPKSNQIYNKGAFVLAKEAFIKSAKDAQETIRKADVDLEQYRTEQLHKFAEMQRAIAKAQQGANFMNQFMEAMNH